MMRILLPGSLCQDRCCGGQDLGVQSDRCFSGWLIIIKSEGEGVERWEERATNDK